MKEFAKLGFSIVAASAVAATVGGAMNFYATSEEERNKQLSMQFAAMTAGAMLLNQATDAAFIKLSDHGKKKEWTAAKLISVRVGQLLALIGLTFLGAIAGKASVKPHETSSEFIQDAKAFPPVLAVAMLSHIVGQMIGKPSNWKNVGVAAISNFFMLSVGAVLFAKITEQPYLAGMSMLLPFVFAGMLALATRMGLEKIFSSHQNSEDQAYSPINDERQPLLPETPGNNTSAFWSCIKNCFSSGEKTSQITPDPV